MRLTQKLAQRVICEVVGEDSLPVISAMYGKKDVSELALARKYKGDINITRNVLYRMHNNNLVSFIKKKDKQKGWYVYYWTLNPQRVRELSIQVNEQKLNALKSRLQREKDQIYYACCNKCVRFDFDKATDFEFKCPECNLLLEEEDNSQIVEHIEKEMAKLEKISA